MPAGTDMTLSFRILQLSRPMERFLEVLQPAHRDRTSDLREDLAPLKKVVEEAGSSS